MTAGNVVQLPPANWREGLIVSEKGAIKKLEFNVRRILARHPQWQGVLAYNEFTLQVEKLKPLPPIGGGADDTSGDAGPMRDVDDTHTAQWLQSKVGLEVSVSMTRTALPTAVTKRFVTEVDQIKGPACAVHHEYVLRRTRRGT